MGTLKCKKMLFGIWLHQCYKIPEFFMIAPVLTSILPLKSWRSLSHYIGLRVRYKYYKNIVVLVWPEAAHAPITV